MNPEILKYIQGYNTYPEVIQLQVLSLMQKMLSLGFISTFKKVEEGPIVRTYYFEPLASSPLAKIYGKEEDLAAALHVESVLITRELGNIAIAVPRIDRELIKFDKELFKLLNINSSVTLTPPIA